jgi:hypothetical protein
MQLDGKLSTGIPIQAANGYWIIQIAKATVVEVLVFGI